MELVGICMICGRPNARYTCRLCGRIVCNNCYDFSNGICVACKGRMIK